MAFRKRNVVLSSRPPAGDVSSSTPVPTVAPVAPLSRGVRPSPIDGRPTISTGTKSLDNLLAGHAGLPLGNSLLIGESGTTDYAGALLRFYAAEGVVQDQKVHVVGMNEAWGRELPGLASDDRREGREAKDKVEKMKIAWRYEGLGQVESTRGSARTERVVNQGGDVSEEPSIFCHTFDLAKRLTLPIGKAVSYIPISQTKSSSSSPFPAIVQAIQQQLASHPSSTIHRIIVPSLLSPALYSPSAALPSSVLQFLHALRALLRQYPSRLTAILTLPLSLYPRSSGLVRWIEILSDGVLELSPFSYSRSQALAQSAGTTKDEERPQGMLAIRKLPVFHERGGGGGSDDVGEDMAFTLSRRKFLIAKFSLPPLEDDTETQLQAERQTANSNSMPRKEDLEF